MKYKQIEDIMCQEDENEKYILFNAKTSSVHILTRYGFLIWKLCENEITPQEIVEKLINEGMINNDSDKCEYEEVTAGFLSELEKRGLIIKIQEGGN